MCGEDMWLTTNKEKEADQPNVLALSSAEATRVFSEYSHELRLFLIGILRDHQLADDVSQTTFVRLKERGGNVDPAKRKSWLFQVAYNEAIGIKRRERIGERVLRKAAWTIDAVAEPADQSLQRGETIESVRRAMDELSDVQREIVRMRIYEDKTFAVIAEELKIPLGTALGRMRAALKRMQVFLRDENPANENK